MNNAVVGIVVDAAGVTVAIGNVVVGINVVAGVVVVFVLVVGSGLFLFT